jgi:hypothetical protein
MRGIHIRHARNTGRTRAHKLRRACNMVETEHGLAQELWPMRVAGKWTWMSQHNPRPAIVACNKETVQPSLATIHAG